MKAVPLACFSHVCAGSPKVLAPPASALSPLGSGSGAGQLTSSSERCGPQTHCVQGRPGRGSMFAGMAKMHRDPSACFPPLRVCLKLVPVLPTMGWALFPPGGPLCGFPSEAISLLPRLGSPRFSCICHLGRFPPLTSSPCRVWGGKALAFVTYLQSTTLKLVLYMFFFKDF